MDDTDKKIATLVVIISLIIVSYGGYRVIKGELAKGVQEDFSIQRGDTVSVEYTGMIYDSRIYGTEPRVFDTNQQHVANDNVTYPKTLSYTWRASSQPLSFTVGAGSVIAGWELNILGMKAGESNTWTIPAEQAYQPRVDGLVVTYNKSQTNPEYESIKREQFSLEYPDAPLLIDVSLTHSRWGWPAELYSVNDTHVTILNKPLFQETYTTGYGWRTYVTGIDSAANNGEGIITMAHQPETGDVVPTENMVVFDSGISAIESVQKQHQQSSSKGIVVSVGQDSFQVDYNKETFGVTLIFQVKILDVSRE